MRLQLHALAQILEVHDRPAAEDVCPPAVESLDRARQVSVDETDVLFYTKAAPQALE